MAGRENGGHGYVFKDVNPEISVTFAAKDLPVSNIEILSNMPIQTDNWTYAEFHAFVMLYAANTDGHISIEEENLISPTLTAEAYLRIKSTFMACDDEDALDIIFSYKEQYCKTQADKDKILADMLEIFQVNVGLEQVERSVLHLFERMLCQ